MWSAWDELSTCRATSMAGLGPIPWSAIHEWARHRGMSPDEEEELRIFVRALDREMTKPKG